MITAKKRIKPHHREESERPDQRRQPQTHCFNIHMRAPHTQSSKLCVRTRIHTHTYVRKRTCTCTARARALSLSHVHIYVHMFSLSLLIIASELPSLSPPFLSLSFFRLSVTCNLFPSLTHIPRERTASRALALSLVRECGIMNAYAYIHI